MLASISLSVNWLTVLVLVVPTASAQEREAPAEDASGSWLSAVQADLTQREYHFSAVEPQHFSAPNRAQGLRSRIGREGIEVFPREANTRGEGAPWTLRIATVALGRDGEAWPLAGYAVTAAGARVEIERGELVEWFENSERGVEQGWTIERPPAGTGELEITLGVTGDLSLRIDGSGRSGAFVDACGAAHVGYEGLRAWDAVGRELEARLVPGPAGVVVRVDDGNAAYPIVVDPLLSNPSWTAESNQAGALFGYSVATAGDVNKDGYSDVIVGALFYDNGETDEGRAFVYHGSASGLSTSPAWSSESNQAGARLGNSVSTAGDVNGDGYSDVIVGAYLYDNGEADEGLVLVYHGSSSGLSTFASWSVDSNQVGAVFGDSVSTAGDVNGDGYSDVIVGAMNYSNGEAQEGRAFVYLGSPGGLSTIASWTAESNQANARFGSVSTAGDVNCDGYSDVIVGAWQYSNGEAGEGRAFVYQGSPSGLSAGAAWTAESNQVASFFGSAVSTAGDVDGDGYSDVVVGAFGYDNGESGEGRAYAYLGSASGLATSPAWTAESNQIGAQFGFTVASAGDVNADGYSDVVVGAWTYGNDQPAEGRAFVYHGSAAGITTSPAWTAESNLAGAYFGYSVASAGDVNADGYSDVIVGAHDYDGGETNEGRAYVYHGSAAGLVTSAGWTAETNQAGADVWGVASAGDVNGDGYSDVIVGSEFYDNGETNEGAAFVYHGSAGGPSLTPDWTVEGGQNEAQLGQAIRTAGDVNGDGYADVIIGVRFYDNGETNEGRALVFHGSPTGLAASPAWSIESDQAEARLGSSVASAGDVNGDGYGDVLVGASKYDNGQTDEGRAWLYLGSAAGLSTSAAWTAESDQAGAEYGDLVASAGDVTGDGYSDVLVGAYLYDNGEANEGRLFLYLGSRTGLANTAVWTAEGQQVGAEFGFSAASAGDVNGDGYSDVIIGAYEYDGPDVNEGRAFLYLGHPFGLTFVPTWIGEPNQGSARYGNSVASAGDVNGDGYSDVIIGARHWDGSQQNEGRAFLYLGSASGLATSHAWSVTSNEDQAQLGRTVASAGDVNGDGYSDVIVAVLFLDAGQADEGQARLYYGNGGDGGLVRELQQLDRTSTRPVSPLGGIGPSGLFRIRCEFPKNAAGFAWATPMSPSAWLEWEVKPIGVPFDGLGLGSGAPQSLVPAGGTLTFDELVPIDDAAGKARTTNARAYRWRARIATNNPLFPHTAWFSPQGNPVTETDLRKRPLPW